MDVRHDGRYRAGRSYHPADTGEPFKFDSADLWILKPLQQAGVSLAGPVPGDSLINLSVV
ncbi:hypothetical protein I552_5136 [Mycobacterium xenopi 3993]|nr:hypothetical protein I552_5136 [Mycobacterium xenopi 3993]